MRIRLIKFSGPQLNRKSFLFSSYPPNLRYLGQVPQAEWTAGRETAKFNGQLEPYIAKFQDPAQSDSMSRLQSDLDDTKIILVS